MTHQPLDHSQPDETDDLRAALVDSLTQGVKHEAQQALRGRARRLQQVAAEFAHLGTVADELLALALQDVERTPDYFAALTRQGLKEALPDQNTAPPDIIEGTAKKKVAGEATRHER